MFNYTLQKRFLLLLSVLAISLTFGSDFSKAQDSDTKSQLRKALEQTHKQLETERKRIEHELRFQEKELKTANENQKQLVNEIVKLKFAIANEKVQLEKKQNEFKDLQKQKETFNREWTEINVVVADACRKVGYSLELLPPSELRNKQKQLLSTMRSQIANSDQSYINTTPLVELFESLLNESRTSAVFNHNVRNPHGYRKQAILFRLGQILYAYKTKSGQIAVACPGSGKKGFRWNENIPDWAKASINSAFENASTTDAILLPVDVTQQMANEQDLSNNSLLGKITAGGPVMIPLAIIAVTAFLLILERITFFIRQGNNPRKVAEEILAACHVGNFKKAEFIAIGNPNVVSRTMLICLTKRNESTADMEDAIAEAILHELPSLERFLSSIAILAGVAPLLGLLGTVTGMISTFDIIKIFGSGQPKLMAGGISEALITTAAGLIIAIPILLVHSFLSSRSDNLIGDTERYSATLLNLLKSQTETTNADTEEQHG